MIKKYTKCIFILSLIFNVLFLSLGCYILYKKGGVWKVVNSVSVFGTSKNELNTYQIARGSFFNIMPYTDNSIVFLGDSLTNNFDWQEMFGGNIKNRGVAGDTTDNIISRLDDIIALNPSKIFIMVGVNDALQGKTVDDISKNYNYILNTLTAKLPNTKIYVENVTPVDFLVFKDGKINDNKKILELNSKIKSIAINHNLIYIDVYSHIVKDDQLNSKFTYDGLHLNGAGYKVWCDQIKQYI